MKRESVPQYLARIKDESERDARIGERAAGWQRWIDKAIEDTIEGGGDVDVEPADLLPDLLAAQHDVFDQETAALDAQHRAETGALRRQLITQEIAHAAERRQRTLEASRLRKRMSELEKLLHDEKQERAALAKALASLDHTVAKDRAHRRLLDARRTYPHASRVELERARRKTDRALDGGFDA